MATVSPPNSSPPSTSTPPPTTANRAPPPQSSPPNPSSQPNATPPVSTSPPVQSPPPPLPQSPPPASVVPPPAATPPPPTQVPVGSQPPRTQPSPPPPPPPTPTSTPPPNVSSPSNPNSPPPASDAPPPSTPLIPPRPPATQRNSPPPPSPATQRNSPPPPPPATEPPTTSPPPTPPQLNSPPAPQTEPPTVSPPPRSPPLSPSSPPPPPPRRQPPQSSPPPPSSISPPENSPPDAPPQTSPPPPRLTPPSSQPTPSPSSPVPALLPPPSVIRLAPPPPSRVPVQPSDNPTVNTPTPNAPESSASPSNSGIGVGGTVAIGLAVGIIVLSLIGLVAWCLRKQKKKRSVVNGGYGMPSPFGYSPRSDSSFIKTQSSAPHLGSSSSSDILYSTPSEPGGLGHSRSWFTYEELVKATNDFSEQNLLGEGGFGTVYKGFLPDGREVAVKQLKIGGGQGEREFKAEVEIIGRIHHRHLVSLVGNCISESRRLLVYDFVPNNNLYFHLHGEGRPVLDWAKRIKIAAGSARGIAYLHEDCFPRIIHRDIKSSNILIDNNFEAQVSDFGLAKLALDANTHVSTRVMGTFGYMAPEYASSGKLTEKSDVFSYGVVLLELITGRKPVDTLQPIGDESLVEWARPLLSHALETQEFGGLVDPRLGQNYIESEMFRMIEAAAACVRHSAVKRPRMGQVVRAFDSLATSDLSNGMKVGESEVFNSAQQSEEIRWFRRMAFGSQNYSTDFFSQSSLGS